MHPSHLFCWQWEEINIGLTVNSKPTQESVGILKLSNLLIGPTKGRDWDWQQNITFQSSYRRGEGGGTLVTQNIRWKHKDGYHGGKLCVKGWKMKKMSECETKSWEPGMLLKTWKTWKPENFENTKNYPLGHAEQLLFSCLGSKVTVYCRKLECFFLDHHTPSGDTWVHRAGSQLKTCALWK